MAVDTLFILQLPFIFVCVCVLLCISYKPLNAQAKRRCPAQLPPGLLNRASLTSHALEATIHGFKLVKTPPYPLTRARRPTISRRVSYLYYIYYIYPACTRGFIRTLTIQTSARPTNSRASHLACTQGYTASNHSKLRQTY